MGIISARLELEKENKQYRKTLNDIKEFVTQIIQRRPHSDNEYFKNILKDINEVLGDEG